MKWTTEFPNVPGFYWFARTTSATRPRLLSIRGVYVYEFGVSGPIDFEEGMDGRYLGPLTPPEVEK